MEGRGEGRKGEGEGEGRGRGRGREQKGGERCTDRLPDNSCHAHTLPVLLYHPLPATKHQPLLLLVERLQELRRTVQHQLVVEKWFFVILHILRTHYLQICGVETHTQENRWAASALEYPDLIHWVLQNIRYHLTVLKDVQMRLEHRYYIYR